MTTAGTSEKDALEHDPGRFIFINKNSATLAKTPEEGFTISSHVSKTHRKWLKEERLRKLQASRSKTVAQRSIIPVKLQTSAVGSSRSAPPEPDASARTIPIFSRSLDGRRNSGAASAYGPAGSHLKGSSKDRFPGSQYSQSVYHFEDSQDNDDQGRRSPALGGRRDILTRTTAPLAPFRGNSDPFSATALPLAAQDHEIIRQAEQFFVFVAHPDKRSTVWRAPIADSSSTDIRLRQTIADEAEVHAILAAGYAVNAKSCTYGQARSLMRGLHHKTKAVELLRDRLVNRGFSQSVTTLIRLLISLDFEACNNEAALVHLRGLWAMASTTPGILADAQELLRVSDVWISISLLKKPEILPSRYDPGERRLQYFDEMLVALDREHGISTIRQSVGITRTNSAFDDRTWTLLEAAQEIVNTKARMDKVDDAKLLHDIIPWLNKRSSAVTGYCTTGYVENTEAAASPETHGTDIAARTLMAAACLCGMMFMNFRFLDLPTNYNFSKTCQRIEDTLRSVSKRLEHARQSELDNDYLWLLFLTSMGNDIFAARGDIPYSSWPVAEFHNLCERLNLVEPHQTVAALRRYPHYAEMDVFLAELLAHKAPATHVVAWPTWRSILNHA